MIPKKALRWTSQGFRKWHGRVGSVLQTGRISCSSFQLEVSILLLMHTIAKFEVFVAFNAVNLSVALCASSNFYREIQIRHFCPPFCCRLGALCFKPSWAECSRTYASQRATLQQTRVCFHIGCLTSVKPSLAKWTDNPTKRGDDDMLIHFNGRGSIARLFRWQRYLSRYLSTTHRWAKRYPSLFFADLSVTFTFVPCCARDHLLRETPLPYACYMTVWCQLQTGDNDERQSQI